MVDEVLAGAEVDCVVVLADLHVFLVREPDQV